MTPESQRTMTVLVSAPFNAVFNVPEDNPCVTATPALFVISCVDSKLITHSVVLTCTVQVVAISVYNKPTACGTGTDVKVPVIASIAIDAALLFIFKGEVVLSKVIPTAERITISVVAPINAVCNVPVMTPPVCITVTPAAALIVCESIT